jgi:hypothetical protein
MLATDSLLTHIFEQLNMKQTKKEKYHQYLNSDEWKIKRLEVINKK